MTEITAGPAASKTVPIEFSGQKMEYTKLWLVNMLLTIITFGIYSAWAKVRNTQYLYGHTQVDGHRLSYLATPMQILRGRIIAVILFSLYALLNAISPLFGAAAVLVLLIAMPWLLIQGIKFSLRMTAYRDVRLSFNATYFQTFGYFFLLPLVGTFTFGFAMPWVVQRIHKFIYENISYGGKSVKLNSRIRTYYWAVFTSFLSIIAALFFIYLIQVIVVAIDVIANLSTDPNYVEKIINSDFTASAMEEAREGRSFFIFKTFLIIFLLAYISSSIFIGIIRNHIVNNLKIESIATFKSNINIAKFSWLNVSNALLIIFTLGLGYPTTQIRKNVFLANATQVNLSPEIDTLVNTVSDGDSAIGEEVAGLFDADLSLT